MSSQALTPKQILLLVVLTIATGVMWKMGQPQTHPSETVSSTVSSASPGSTTGTEQGKKCCEKPPNKAALMMENAAPTPPSNAQAPAPTDASK